MTGRVTTDWSQALCLDASPDMFFPGVGDNWVAQQAKALCRQCPIRQECGEWAIANLLNKLEDCGIWGGMGPKERRAERQRRGIKLTGERASDVLRPCGTAAAYRRHQRRGEKPCRTCLEAQRRDFREYYGRKRGAA